MWFKGELQRFCWKLKTHSEDPKRGENRLQMMLNSGFHCLKDNSPFKMLENTAQFPCSTTEVASDMNLSDATNDLSLGSTRPQRTMRRIALPFLIHDLLVTYTVTQINTSSAASSLSKSCHKKELILHLLYIPWAIVWKKGLRWPFQYSVLWLAVVTLHSFHHFTAPMRHITVWNGHPNQNMK